MRSGSARCRASSIYSASPQHIDEACRKALHLGSLRYNTVAKLVDDIDETAAEPAAADLLHEHPVLRPLSEYQLYLDGLEKTPRRRPSAQQS